MSEYSIFPKALDGYAQLPLAVDKRSPINAESVNRLRSAIVNIEKALGSGVISSELHGDFADLAKRLNSIDGLVRKLEDESDFDNLYQSLKDSLIEMFEDLDLDEILEPSTLTSLYLNDPEIRLEEDPLVLKKGDTSCSLGVSETFLVKSDSSITLETSGSSDTWFYGTPLSKSLILKSTPTDLALGGLKFSNYLNLEDTVGNSPFSLFRIHSDSLDSVHLAFGMDRGRPDVAASKDFTVNLSIYEVAKPGIDGGSMEIRSGDCASGSKAGDLRLRAGMEGDWGYGAGLHLRGAGGGAQLRGGEPDEEDSGVAPYLELGEHSKENGGQLYFRAGALCDRGGHIYLNGGEGDETGGDVYLRGGTSPMAAGSVYILAGDATSWGPGSERGNISLSAKRISLTPSEEVVVSNSFDASSAKTKVGAVYGNVRAVSTSGTIGGSDHTLVCDAGTAITLTLPNNPELGRILYIKNLSNTFPVSITDGSSPTGIDDSFATLSLPDHGDYAQLQRAQNSWIILATSV